MAAKRTSKKSSPKKASPSEAQASFRKLFRWSEAPRPRDEGGPVRGEEAAMKGRLFLEGDRFADPKNDQALDAARPETYRQIIAGRGFYPIQKVALWRLGVGQYVELQNARGGFRFYRVL